MPTQIPLVGDARETLSALAPMLERKTDRSFLSDAQEGMESWREDMHALETMDTDPIQPQAFVATIDRLADDDAILACDTGTVTAWAARHWNVRGDREFYVSGNLASMAPGLPYALAAQVVHPERQILALVGDGGFSMLMGEYLTAARYGLPVKVFVCNNGLLGQILWEQLALGYPEFGVRWQQPADFAPWATACGGLGIRVDKYGDLEGAVRDALAYDGPALVDCVVNPDEPPMPAKLRYKDVKGFTEAWLKGEYERMGIVSTLARDKFAKLKAR
jgi:thiamine pyrophosphate-dependent acetolactate synthase large subunit-like protein